MKYTIDNHAWDFITLKCWQRCSAACFMHLEVYEGTKVAYIENWYSVCGILGDPVFYDVKVSDTLRWPVAKETCLSAFIYTVILR